MEKKRKALLKRMQPTLVVMINTTPAPEKGKEEDMEMKKRVPFEDNLDDDLEDGYDDEFDYEEDEEDDKPKQKRRRSGGY
jgi:hypothetical protein